MRRATQVNCHQHCAILYYGATPKLVSSQNKDIKSKLLVKQEPTTNASLLRTLKSSQVKLWQEVGRRGMSLGELEKRHPNRDILEEVMALEAQGAVVMEEEAIQTPSKPRQNRSTDSTEATKPASQGARKSRTTSQPVVERRRRISKPIRESGRRDSRHSNATPALAKSLQTNPLHEWVATKRAATQRAANQPDNTAEDSNDTQEWSKQKSAGGKANETGRKPTPPTTPLSATQEWAAEQPTGEASPRGLEAGPLVTGPLKVRDWVKTPIPPPTTNFETQPLPELSSLFEGSHVAEGSAKSFLLEPDEEREQPEYTPPESNHGAVPRISFRDDSPPQGEIDLEGGLELGDTPAEDIDLGSIDLDQNFVAIDQGHHLVEHTNPLLGEDTAVDTAVSQGANFERGSGPTPDRSKTTPDMPGMGSGVVMPEASKLENITDKEREMLLLDVELSEAEKHRILEVARAVELGSITQLLGLPITAKRKKIKKAYFQLSKELHPDQYFGKEIGPFKKTLEGAFKALAQYVKALSDKRTTLPGSYRTNNQSRRKSQRFHVGLRAQVQCESWELPEWASTQDISEGGLFLVTDVVAILGETIRINIDSPRGVVGIIGKVVSMRGSDDARRKRRNAGLGVQFINAGQVDYKRLQNLLGDAKANTPVFGAALPVRSEASKKMASGNHRLRRKEHIIGIDLGTTNTAVSAVVDNRVQIVPWPNGSYSMPSIVSFPERNKCVVGHEAHKHLLRDPRHVISSGKRLIGRQLNDPEIASYMAEARFAHHAGPDGTVIAKLQGEEYAIPQICSYLFSAGKHSAAKMLGSEPTKVVLTMPVSYEQVQIDAMRKAAQLAQLDVIEIIEEPCAAAIANQGQKDFHGIVGVYDFGGGTFDFSLVEAGTGDMRVLATTGDSWLGGDDFDLAIADAAANLFWKAEGADLRQKAVEWEYLVYACEQAKRDLSKRERTQVVVPEVLRKAQGTIDLRVNLVRSKVEELWISAIQRSVDTCNQALGLAGVPKSKLSAIYMSGGTSYIPAIRRTLMEHFSCQVHLGLAPEHAVCAGAGIRAAILQGV